LFSHIAITLQGHQRPTCQCGPQRSAKLHPGPPSPPAARGQQPGAGCLAPGCHCTFEKR
jgi:hypothetical protein